MVQKSTILPLDMGVKKNIKLVAILWCLEFHMSKNLTSAYETIQCSELLQNHYSIKKSFLDVTHSNELASLNLLNCVELSQAKRICKKRQHTKWIDCDMSATSIIEKQLYSTPSAYVESNILHRPISIKPTTEISSYFNDHLDDKSDIFGNNFQLANDLVEEHQFFDLPDEIADESESATNTEIPKTESETTTSTFPTTLSTTSSTLSTPTTTTSTTSSTSTPTVSSSRLPRTTPTISIGVALTSSDVFNILTYFIIFWNLI